MKDLIDTLLDSLNKYRVSMIQMSISDKKRSVIFLSEYGFIVTIKFEEEYVLTIYDAINPDRVVVTEKSADADTIMKRIDEVLEKYKYLENK